jgi:hypothetical protein
MEERMTLCNMVVEAGGKNGIVAADKTTYKYLEVVRIYQFPLCSQFRYLCLLSVNKLVINAYAYAYESCMFIHATC